MIPMDVGAVASIYLTSSESQLGELACAVRASFMTFRPDGVSFAKARPSAILGPLSSRRTKMLGPFIDTILSAMLDDSLFR
jgi:hypothetical protein